MENGKAILKEHDLIEDELGNAENAHKSFEDRLKEYNGKISVCDFDWGEPLGREML